MHLVYTNKYWHGLAMLWLQANKGFDLGWPKSGSPGSPEVQWKCAEYLSDTTLHVLYAYVVCILLPGMHINLLRRSAIISKMSNQFETCWQGIDISGAGILALALTLLSILFYSIAVGTDNWAETNANSVNVMYDVNMGLFKYCSNLCMKCKKYSLSLTLWKVVFICFKRS